MNNHKRVRFSKISVRLSFAYAIVFFITIIILNITILASIQFYTNQTNANQLQDIKDTILREIHTETDISNFDFAELSKTSENIDILLLQGSDILVSTNGEYQQLPESSQSVRRLETAENTVMYITGQITLEGGAQVAFQVIKNIDNDLDFFNALFSGMIIIDAVIIVLSVLVGFFISRKALSPIDSMTKQAREISTSNLGQRIIIEGPDDELSRLARTFNELIARLSKAYIMQNEFALNASHELSTPLSVIKGYIDLIDRWGKEDKSVFDEAILSIKNELHHMTGLLDALYMVSKTDNELIPIEKTEFCLDDLLQQVLKEYALVFEEETFEFQSESKQMVFGDPKLISQMVRALLDNSIKYNRHHSPIQILLRNGDMTELEIKDEGVGIPSGDLEHVFERFFRVDRARTKTIQGSGLGLSIVKWIVDMHHGTVRIDSELEKGTSVIIHLPRKA